MVFIPNTGSAGMYYERDILSLKTASSLGLQRATAYYIIRCESARVVIKYLVFCNLIKFWLRILELENNRIMKICYTRLLQLHSPGLKDSKYNWATLLRHQLEDVGFGFVWDAQDPSLVRNHLDSMLCYAPTVY